MADEEKILKEMRRIRGLIVLDYPFWAMISLHRELVCSRQVPTAATDGRTLWFNPEYVESLMFEERRSLFVHEAGHIVLLHPLRVEGHDFEKFNVAADYKVNQMIDEAGMPLGKGWLRDRQYDAMSTEQVYKVIPDPPKGDGGGGQGPGGQPGELPGPVVVVAPTDEHGNGLSPAELERLSQETKVMVSQAAAMAKAMGSLPAGMERFIDALKPPKAGWKELLARYLTQTMRDDYSWLRPNRRYISQGLYLPSLNDEATGNLVLVMDTSGSVSDRQLQQFAGHINMILEEFEGLTVKVLYCDTEVSGVEEFTSDDRPVRLHPKGGGGTDFRPAFKWVSDNRVEVEALVYFTDLHCSRYPVRPEYPVIWVAIEEGHGNKPPWGQFVKMT